MIPKKKYINGKAYSSIGRRSKNPLLSEMLKKAKFIRDIRKIRNAMLSSGAYSDKEKEKQIRMAEIQGDLNDEELRMVNETWEEQNELSKEIMLIWNDYKEKKRLLKNEKSKT